MPISLSVEPTTACNLRCPECPSGLRAFTRPIGRLNPDLYKKIIDELHETLYYLILYFQGEPYLHRQFLELVQYASERKIYSSTSTNGHFLNDSMACKTVESGLDRLIISIDGATQETYESYRKSGSLDKVLEGTKNIMKWKKQMRSSTPNVVWQFLVVKPNEHEIPEIRKMAKAYGVDRLVFKSAQIHNYEHGNGLIPNNLKYSRYKPEKDGKWALKNAIENECWKMWHSAVMTWDGKIVPCCFNKDAEHVMGDVSKDTFTNVWFSEAYHEFRKALLEDRKSMAICKNCTEGVKVWV